MLLCSWIFQRVPLGLWGTIIPYKTWVNFSHYIIFICRSTNFFNVVSIYFFFFTDKEVWFTCAFFLLVQLKTVRSTGLLLLPLILSALRSLSVVLMLWQFNIWLSLTSRWISCRCDDLLLFILLICSKNFLTESPIADNSYNSPSIEKVPMWKPV